METQVDLRLTRLRNLLAHGSEEPQPHRLHLRAGLLELDLVDGQLRRLRIGDREVIRRVYFAARDAAWRTAPDSIAITNQEVNASDFAVTLAAQSRLGALQLEWQAETRGTADSCVTYSVSAVALSDCTSNRIGLCVLHPADCAGEPCEVTHSDGTVQHGRFPYLVAPQQPFTDIKAISYRARRGLRVEAAFEGDIFEMEDQRNWSDGSFKTYSGALGPEYPLPMHIKAGTRIRQQVTICLAGTSAPSAKPRPRGITVTAALGAGRCLPNIGLGIPAASGAIPGEVLEHLRRLQPAHLRLELYANQELTDAQIRTLSSSRVPLEIALQMAPVSEPPAHAWLEAIRLLQPRIARWLVYGARYEQLAGICAQLRELFAGVPVGSGSNENLAELNRARPDISAIDLVACALNPQVHQFDDDNLVENLGSQAAVAATIRHIAAGKPIAISPLSLKPRFISVAGAPKRQPLAAEIASIADPRQVSLLGASWLALTIANLGVAADIASFTVYDAWGWRGVLETESEPAFASRWPALTGALYPAYHVLRWLGARSGSQLLPAASSHPLQVGALALRRAESTEMLVCNLSAQPLQVRVEASGLASCYALLSPDNAIEALHDPAFICSADQMPIRRRSGNPAIDLPAWGIAFIGPPGT